MAVFKPALVYGLLGFCAGCFFGVLREIVLVPAFGVRAGHWLEFVPLLLVIMLTGFWVTRRWRPGNIFNALLVGVPAVMVLLIFESTLALAVLKVPLSEYLESFNILNGQLFPLGLFIMAIAPAVFIQIQK